GTIAAPGAGFIGDIAGFDADFFGISPREARQMDPQQRLSLQTSWHALEDAGINPQSLAGTNCAVVFGATTVDYAGRVMAQPATIDAYCVTGVFPFAIANRVSYALDLRGP